MDEVCRVEDGRGKDRGDHLRVERGCANAVAKGADDERAKIYYGCQFRPLKTET